MNRDLLTTIEGLPHSARRALTEHGFDAARFADLVERAGRGELNPRLEGRVEPPRPGDVEELPEPGSSAWSELTKRGQLELQNGRCALLVMAGGMATRMGGAVKALVDALPGHSFLDLRLAEQELLNRREGKRPPLWLMTSQATNEAIRHALVERGSPSGTSTFSQHLSLRFTPSGELYFDERGLPSLHATGHGDTLDALRASGLLQHFVASGGKTVFVTNVDNVGGTLDPTVLGWHLSHGSALTSEVVDKVGSDRGGIPARVDGKLRAVEEFRLPADFDATAVPVFNINSFWFDAERMLTTDVHWSFFPVEKQVNGQKVLQLERILNEVTATLPTRFLRVPREGKASRFLPVKDTAELGARQSEIRAVARARGLVPDVDAG